MASQMRRVIRDSYKTGSVSRKAAADAVRALNQTERPHDASPDTRQGQGCAAKNEPGTRPRKDGREANRNR
jgi:hypothetical protein